MCVGVLSVMALGSDLLTKYSLIFAVMINSFVDEQSCQMWNLKLSIKIRQSEWIHYIYFIYSLGVFQSRTFKDTINAAFKLYH